MKMNFYKLNSIIISVSIVVISGLLINLGNMLTIIFNADSQLIFNILLAFSVSIGFILIPLVILRCLKIPYIKINFNVMFAVILFISIFTISEFILKSEETVHALIIAIGEEFLFRVIILSVLLTSFKKRTAFIIGSLIFAILPHLNGDFLLNLIVKFPSSIVLYILADKFGLQSSIAFHWLYNICVGVLFG